MIREWRCKYEFTLRFDNPFHVYSVLGALGGLSFHVTDRGEKEAEEAFGRYSGGLEAHYRTPPDYMSERPPSHDECWLLCAPCWHDGTSLYASETIIPYWLTAPDDHVRMFKFLEQEANERFYAGGEE